MRLPGQLQTWETPANVQSLAVSPDGKLLASGDTNGTISLWQAETGELVRRLEGHSERISESGGLAFSPSGKLLASGSYDDTARVWDVGTGKTLQILKGHNDNVKGVAFSPDEKCIATSSTDKRLVLWEVESGQQIQVFDGHQNYATGVGFVSRRPHADTDPAGSKGDAPLLVSASYRPHPAGVGYGQRRDPAGLAGPYRRCVENRRPCRSGCRPRGAGLQCQQ